MARLVMERADVVPLLAEVFRRYGFEGTSIARITAATKLGKGSLYHFFPGGKDEMAEAVLAHIDGWFEAKIFRPLADGPTDEALANMFDSVDAYFQSGRRICLIGAFALEETRDRFAHAISDYFRRWINALSSALSRAGHSDADHCAVEVVGGIQGAIVLARALGDDRVFLDLSMRLAHRCGVSARRED